jgi:hypothetical protein
MTTTTVSRTLCLVSILMLAARATAQEPPTILQVDFANGVLYVNDVNDPSKLAGSRWADGAGNAQRFLYHGRHP